MYQYKVIESGYQSALDLEFQLNQLANTGWRLVASLSGPGAYFKFILEREVG